MSKIEKIKEYGFYLSMIKAFKMVFRKLIYLLDEKERKYKWKHDEAYLELKKISTDSKYKSVYIFYPYTEWNIPIFQRPQQIALSLTNDPEILYLFCTVNNNCDKVNGLFEKIKDNLILVTDFEFINKLKIKNKIIHLYSTDLLSNYSIVEKTLKKGNKVLYEYIDEIHESITGDIPKSFFEKHEKIMSNEKVSVIATADKLLKDVKKCRKNNYALSTNGVTLEDFVVSDKRVPEKLKDIKNKYSKVICYYGSLAVWFDYELVIKCAKKYKDYAFVLIGYEYDDSMKKSNVDKYENIIYLGKINYSELINYTQHVDLLTIPFLINEVTESTSPVKLFEYMATKKPILTTAMPECKKYGSVIIGENHNDFVKKVETAINKIDDPEYIELEYKEACENTWNEKAQIIERLIHEGEK